MWWWDATSLAEAWGFAASAGDEETVPIEERCWSCDWRRIHQRDDGEECRAGLCGDCCERLRKVA